MALGEPVMREPLKRLARGLLGEYAIYQIWRIDRPSTMQAASGLLLRPLQSSDLAQAGLDAELAHLDWYFGEQAFGMGCFENGQLLSVCFFWWGTRYAQRNSWAIKPPAAKLVHIVTLAAARGRGIAPLLIQAGAAQMHARGHAPLYARIWYSHTASQRAFSRAGWRRCGWLLQINPLRRAQPWSLRLGRL